MTSCLKGFNRPPKELTECYVCDTDTTCYSFISKLHIGFTGSVEIMGNFTHITEELNNTSNSGNATVVVLSLVVTVLFLLLIGIIVRAIYRKKCNQRPTAADREPLLNDFSSHRDEPQQTTHEKPILGDKWHMKKCIDNRGGTILFEKYDVHLRFPNDAIFEHKSAEIFLSIHTDVPAIMRVFKVDQERIIIAPVVECFIPDIKKLDEYAILTIPHCVRQNTNKMHVQWFDNSGAYLKEPTGKDVVILKSVDEHSPFMDIFCVDAHDGYLRIYTKHFSTIVCSHHGQIEFDLQASLYEKLGRIDECQSLRLKLDLGGPLMTLKGFWEDNHDKMEKLGFRTSEKEMQIDLVPKQEEGSVLQFRIGLLGRANKSWTHVRREGKEELVHQIIQTKRLKEILLCQIENHNIITNIQWYLKGSCTKSSSLPIHVDIINIRNMNVHDSEGVEDRRKSTINTEIRTCETSIETPDFTMKEVFCFLTGSLSNTELKRTVRLLDFKKDCPNIENTTGDEIKDFWFRTLMEISTGKEQNLFKDDLLRALKLVSQPALEEVRRLLATSSPLCQHADDSDETEPKRNDVGAASKGSPAISTSGHDLHASSILPSRSTDY